MKPLTLLPLAVLLLGLTGGSSSQTKKDSPASTAGRFGAVDVYIDPQGKPLAAYQFELSARGADVTLAGVEGGEHAAFAPPPYYDPRANVERRIVIAAFNTGPDLPSAKMRVARLMVHIEGSAEPQYAVRLQVAASADATSIPATINVKQGARR